jgi:hypothetical protein
MPKERFVLRPGALVVGPDESLGWIDALLVTPGSRQISGFVLSEGFLFNRGVVVPIELVDRTADSRIHVRLTASRLNDLADGQRRDSARSTGGWPIEAGQRVVCRDGDVGPLVLVMVEPSTSRMTEIVVGRDDSPGIKSIVPVAWALDVTGDPIVLDASRQQLESLPEYRPDDAITDAVSSLLWYRSDIRPADLHHVRVRAHNGIVELSGMTRTAGSRMAIEGLVRGMSGVLGVHNEIRTFEALGAAAQAFRDRGGPTLRPTLDTSAPIPLHLDGSGSANDGVPQTDEAAPVSELDEVVASPLKIVA